MLDIENAIIEATHMVKKFPNLLNGQTLPEIKIN